jgi:hypothetical protein
LVNGGVHLTAVIHNAAALRLFTSFDETRDRERGEQPNDGNHNHDFYQGERRAVFADFVIHLFHLPFLEVFYFHTN